MRRIRFLLLLFIIANSANCQFYLSGYSGYSVATEPVTVNNKILIDTMISLSKTRFSYGKGLNLGIGAGFVINENFTVELICNTQILTGSEQNIDWPSLSDNAQYQSFFSGLNGYAKLRNFNLQIAPLLLYTVKVGKVNPYIKAGPNILFSGSKINRKYTISSLNEDIFEGSYKYTGGLSIGFRGACGVTFEVNQRLRIYGEFMSVISDFNYKKEEILVFKINGADQLPTIWNRRVTEYKDDEGLVDYSHIGFNFGIRYFLKSPL